MDLKDTPNGEIRGGQERLGQFEYQIYTFFDSGTV